jgi:hypothetical protein
MPCTVKISRAITTEIPAAKITTTDGGHRQAT